MKSESVTNIQDINPYYCLFSTEIIFSNVDSVLAFSSQISLLLTYSVGAMYIVKKSEITNEKGKRYTPCSASVRKRAEMHSNIFLDKEGSF